MKESTGFVDYYFWFLDFGFVQNSSPVIFHLFHENVPKCHSILYVIIIPVQVITISTCRMTSFNFTSRNPSML